MAREIATICISPPDRFSQSRSIRYSSAENSPKQSPSDHALKRLGFRPSARLVRTLSEGKIRRFSGTQPMPRRAILSVESRVVSHPSNSTLPSRAGVRPRIERRTVVFPAPLAPSSATASPARDVDRDAEQRLGFAVERLHDWSSVSIRRPSRDRRRAPTGSSAAPRACPRR